MTVDLSTLTHAPRCPALPSSGAAGPCLCIPKREHAPAWVPTTRLSVDMSGTSRINGKVPGSKLSHVHDRHAAVKEANARLRAAGWQWNRDVIPWARETSHPDAARLTPSTIHPLVVDAFLAVYGVPAGQGQ